MNAEQYANQLNSTDFSYVAAVYRRQFGKEPPHCNVDQLRTEINCSLAHAPSIENFDGVFFAGWRDPEWATIEEFAASLSPEQAECWQKNQCRLTKEFVIFYNKTTGVADGPTPTTEEFERYFTLYEETFGKPRTLKPSFLASSPRKLKLSSENLRSLLEEDRLTTPEGRALYEEYGPLFNPRIDVDHYLSDFSTNSLYNIIESLAHERLMELLRQPYIKSGLPMPPPRKPSTGEPLDEMPLFQDEMPLSQLQEEILELEKILKRPPGQRTGFEPCCDKKALQQMIDGLSLDKIVRDRIIFIQQREEEWCQSDEAVLHSIDSLKQEVTRRRGPLFDRDLTGFSSFSLPELIERQIAWEEAEVSAIKSGLTRPAPSQRELSLSELRELRDGQPELARPYNERLQQMIDGLPDEIVRKRLVSLKQEEAKQLDNVIPFQQSNTDNAAFSKKANKYDGQSFNADDNRTQHSPLPFSNMSNWDNEPVPNREWAVPDRIPLRQVSLFSGEGGAGKSYIALHQCVAHTLGRDWLGSRPVSGPAIFLDAEDDESEIRIRLNSILKHYSATHADLIKGGFHLMSRVGQDSVLGTVSRSGKIEPTQFYNQLLQAAGDIKPKMIGIASLSNIFAGSEIDRGQVQQFSSLITRLGQVANGSVLLVSHPSLVGINTGTGLSGSTQWHNSVRSRIYLTSVASPDGEQPDSDLRELVFKKLQYGALPDSIILRYQNGMFLPVQGAVSIDKEAQLETGKKVFLTILAQYDVTNRTVSDKSGRSYAPALFAKEDEAKSAGLHAKILEFAMRDLFKERKIWNEPCGKPSRPAYRIALAPTVRQQTNEISEQDSVSRWAQACIDTGSITGSKAAWAHTMIGQPATSELIYESYKKYCKKHKLCPEEETAFNKTCEEMFGPPKQISPDVCTNYFKKPTSLLGYDIPDANKWQRKLVERLKKQDKPH